MAPIEFIGDKADGSTLPSRDELHQLAGDTAQGNGSRRIGTRGKKLIALTGTLMGGYADDLFNIFYRMEPHTHGWRGLCLRRSGEARLSAAVWRAGNHRKGAGDRQRLLTSNEEGRSRC